MLLLLTEEYLWTSTKNPETVFSMPPGPGEGEKMLSGWVPSPVVVRAEDAAMIQGKHGDATPAPNGTEQPSSPVPLSVANGFADREEKKMWWARPRAAARTAVAAIVKGINDKNKFTEARRRIRTAAAAANHRPRL